MGAAPGALQEELASRLPSLDPDLSKTWALLKGVLLVPEPSKVFLDWLQIVLNQERGASEVPREPLAAVSDLLSALVPMKSKSNKRSLNLLRLHLLGFRWKGVLPSSELARRLAWHFVPQRESVELLDRHLVAVLLKASGRQQLRDLARLFEWMFRQDAAQALEVARLRKELDLSRTEVVRLGTKLHETSAELADAVDAGRRLTSQLTDLELQLKDARNAGVLRVQGLASRAKGKLKGRVTPLLTQSIDAVDMAEPQVRAVRAFIETAVSEIEELTTWLDSESTSGRQIA